MGKRSRNDSDSDSDDSDGRTAISVKLLTPTTVGYWREAYMKRALIKFGDAACELCLPGERQENRPLYMQYSKLEWARNPLDPLNPDGSTEPQPDETAAVKNEKRATRKERYEEYVYKVKEYEKHKANLFKDMMKHMSQDSMSSLNKDPVRLNNILKARSPGDMWDYVYLTHTSDTLTASGAELRKVRRQVENMRQGSQAYEAFAEDFKAKLKTAQSLNPEIFSQKSYPYSSQLYQAMVSKRPYRHCGTRRTLRIVRNIRETC